ncbi:MAG: filamentous hemagglutinin N-terminal domain-containing protein, partial [Gammaproteobacteria bacterium]|nr:filamentous hemagglutinin N-terminal domain-containing protein [Gammaproteobacteria bacterium]
MNKIYRLIWNRQLNLWVVASEIARGRGKSSGPVGQTPNPTAQQLGNSRSGAWLLRPLCLSIALCLPGSLLAAPPANQLPTGGNVVAGSASISQSTAVMNITQSSPRAAIDWHSFNVGSQAQVNFHQPSASSVTLNRVLSSKPSQIFGQINANGQVFLSNPNGVYFAPGASVNVGGLVATTHGISNEDFIAGN